MKTPQQFHGFYVIWSNLFPGVNIITHIALIDRFFFWTQEVAQCQNTDCVAIDQEISPGAVVLCILQDAVPPLEMAGKLKHMGVKYQIYLERYKDRHYTQVTFEL